MKILAINLPTRLINYPNYSLKTSYTTHNFRHLAGLILFRIRSISIKRIGPTQEQVSTDGGSFTYAIMDAQHPHFQHSPQSGRPKQAQEVSSICSLTDFQARLHNKYIDQNNVPITITIIANLLKFVKFTIIIFYSYFLLIILKSKIYKWII